MIRTGQPVTKLVALGTLTALLAGGVAAEAGQGTTTRQGTPPTISAGGRTDWSSHNLDLHNGRYAELDQINTGNANRLRSAWSFDVPAGVDVSQVTPLVVDGMMYFCEKISAKRFLFITSYYNNQQKIYELGSKFLKYFGYETDMRR